MNILQKFYEVEEMREAVKAFFMEQLQILAVDRVFSKEDTAGIYEAKEVLEKSFGKLDEMFKKIDVTETSSR